MRVIASEFNQWRLNKLVIKYRPNTFQGSYSAGASGTTVPYGTYPDTTVGLHTKICAGFNMDPVTGSLTYPEVIQAGGKDFNAARPFSWTLNGSGRWLFCRTLGSPLTPADIRQTVLAQFNCVSWTTGPNNPTDGFSFGSMQIHWDISFRYPLDPSTDDVARRTKALECASSMFTKLNITHKHSHEDEKKEDAVLVGKKDALLPFLAAQGIKPSKRA